MTARRNLHAIFIALLVVGALAGVPAGAQEGGTPVDLELVIAVDVSRSMDADEFSLQRSGYSQAIRSADFVRAATSGGHRKIALTYVEWSGRLYQKIVVPWRLIDGAEAAEAFAAALDREPVSVGRGTSISAAIEFSRTLFHANGYEGLRRDIDVSGDGPNNYGPPVREARDAALAEGIVINGLPILIRPSPVVPDLVDYYSDCVIGGPGSFVLPVRDVAEFAVAIRRKLVLEVAARTAVEVTPVSAAAPADCMIGEKARERYSDQYYPALDD